MKFLKLIFLFLNCVNSFSQSIENELLKLKGVKFESISTDTNHFAESYKLMVRQPINHQDTTEGFFYQKVYLSHLSVDKPMVMYLNGYIASSNLYITEFTKMLEGNQIHVEHRYFGESVPSEMLWKYLTIEQAAIDQHKIVELLKPIYSKKWVSTGISKGGQTTIIHRSLFPNDVEVSIPYVAPLNLEQEDDRVDEFLKTVGTDECRKRVIDYQRSILSSRKEALRIFAEKKIESNIDYLFNDSRILELSVLEFGFAFWQWDGNCENIPSPFATIDAKMDYLFKVDAPGFFTKQGTKSIFPFFYQAYFQMGMYGYDITDYKDLLVEYKSNISNYRTFIPSDFNLVFDSTAMQKVNQWVRTEGDNIIYIYGENDPWSATAVHLTPETNAIKLVKSGGNHKTRINDLSKAQKAQVYNALRKWLNLEITELVTD